MFDLRTHIRDAKTGALTGYQPYSKKISKDGTFYERPPKSGNLFSEDGTEAGRMIDGVLNKTAAHVDIVPAKTERDALIGLNADQAEKIAKLEAELIEREAEAKMAQANPETKPEVKIMSAAAEAKADAKPNKK